MTPLGELTPLTSVRWQRIRDDISTAEVVVPTSQCCELLGDLRTIRHELHIERNGVVVWQGPITRLEYEWDLVRIFAADVLWQATRTVLTAGYDNSYPNIGYAMDRMDWLLRSQCYALHGDPWKVVPHLRPKRMPLLTDEARTSRVVNNYQYTVWEDFDKYAEDYGTDYTVVNRDIYYWDQNLAWNIIDPLDEQFLSQFPRIVEYGNQLATRGYVTNGHGYAGIATAPQAQLDDYGYVDLLTTNENDGQADGIPSADEVASWAKTAGRTIDDRAPSPVAIVIPANTTLLPGAPWTIDELVPGAWFEVSTSRMCRSVTQYQRLHEVVVTEEAPAGESVAFSATTAPATMVIP